MDLEDHFVQISIPRKHNVKSGQWKPRQHSGTGLFNLTWVTVYAKGYECSPRGVSQFLTRMAEVTHLRREFHTHIKQCIYSEFQGKTRVTLGHDHEDK